MRNICAIVGDLQTLSPFRGVERFLITLGGGRGRVRGICDGQIVKPRSDVHSFTKETHALSELQGDLEYMEEYIKVIHLHRKSIYFSFKK